nr:MAG TPA: hypothetical protein [Caudoviricetes sp.]
MYTISIYIWDDLFFIVKIIPVVIKIRGMESQFSFRS